MGIPTNLLGAVGINYNPSTVMHIDLNSCFATIEQQANPLLRSRALVVAAYATYRHIASGFSRYVRGRHAVAVPKSPYYHALSIRMGSQLSRSSLGQLVHIDATFEANNLLVGQVGKALMDGMDMDSRRNIINSETAHIKIFGDS